MRRGPAGSVRAHKCFCSLCLLCAWCVLWLAALLLLLPAALRTTKEASIAAKELRPGRFQRAHARTRETQQTRHTHTENTQKGAAHGLSPRCAIGAARIHRGGTRMFVVFAADPADVSITQNDQRAQTHRLRHRCLLDAVLASRMPPHWGTIPAASRSRGRGRRRGLL
jgi:hypothetical protein